MTSSRALLTAASLVLVGTPAMAQQLPNQLPVVEAPFFAGGVPEVGLRRAAAFRPVAATLGEPQRCSTMMTAIGLASLSLGGAAGGYVVHKLIVGVWSSTSSPEERRALRGAVIGGAVFGLTVGIVRLARHELCDPF